MDSNRYAGHVCISYPIIWLSFTFILLYQILLYAESACISCIERKQIDGRILWHHIVKSIVMNRAWSTGAFMACHIHAWFIRRHSGLIFIVVPSNGMMLLFQTSGTAGAIASESVILGMAVAGFISLICSAKVASYGYHSRNMKVWWWRRDRDTLPALLPICEGIHEGESNAHRLIPLVKDQ